LATSAVVAGVLFTTLAPSLDKIDSGELAAVQYTGGVAHPTGYPLFTLVGWLFSRLPIGTPIWRLNLLSLLFVAGGAFLFMQATYRFLLVPIFQPKTKQVGDNSAKQKKKVAQQPVQIAVPKTPALIASVIAGVALAFSRTFWEQGTSIEVYSLHVLLLGLLLFMLAKAWAAPAGALKPWLGVAVSLALAFGNHLTTVVTLPAIAVLFFAKHKFTLPAFKTLGWMLAVFFPLLICLYAWLPLRSGTSPAMNWGSTDGWDFFWYHVSGKQFRVWWFTGQKAFNKNFTHFFAGAENIAGLGKQFAWGGLAFALLGWGLLLVRRRALGVFALVLFCSTLLYVCNYAIPDLAPYFLACYFALALGIAACAHEVLQWPRTQKAIRYSLAGTMGLVALAEVPLHHASVSKADLWMYEDYSRQALESLPKDAVVITFQWDHLVSEAYYLQQAEQVRPDVLLVEYEIMKDRVWYKDHLIRHAPELMSRIKPELDAFYKALEPFYFEGDESAFPRLQQTWPRLVWALITEGSKTRPVFIGPEIFWERINTQRGKEMELPPGYGVVPGAYFYQLVPQTAAQNYVDIAPRKQPVRMGEYKPKEDYYSGRLRWYLMVVAHDRALYELSMGKPDRAKVWRDEALRLNPTVQLPPQLQGL
jgi:hypothetical protein